MSHWGTRDDMFSNFLEIIIARKFLVAVGIITVLITSATGIYLMPSMYQASTRIIVSPPALPASDMPFLSDFRNSPSFVSNQRELIRSKLVYERVVIDLRLFEKLERTSFINQAMRKLFRVDTDPFDEAIDTLYRNTSVEVLRGTNIIQITVRSSTSMGAAEIANAIARSYINYINSLVFNRAQNAYSYIETELGNSRDRLTAAQEALDSFKEREKVISVSAVEDAMVDIRKRINEYEFQIKGINRKIENPDQSDIPETREATQEAVSSGRPPAAKHDATVVALENELRKKQEELLDMLSKKTENHPDVIKARSKVENVHLQLSRAKELAAKERKELYIQQKPDRQKAEQRDIQLNKEELNARLEKLKSRKDELFSQIQTEKTNLGRQAINVSRLAKLIQEVTVREKEYMTLRERYEKAGFLKVNDDEKENNFRIVDSARPPALPDNKKKMILMVVSIMVSITFGVGIAFVAEYFDDSFRDRSDVEDYLNLPILGTMPTITKKLLKAAKIKDHD